MSRWPRRAAGLLALLALAFVGRVFHSSWTSTRADYAGVPSPAAVATPAAFGLGELAEVRFPRRGEAGTATVAAWYAPPAAAADGAAVILGHGVRAERSTLAAELRLLHAAGYGVLALDWPGHGGSAGPNDWGPTNRRALLGALDWLRAQPGIDPARIGVLGFSMGGHMVAQAAANEPGFAAVALLAPVIDLRWQLVQDHSKWGWLSQWPALLAARSLNAPLDEETPLAAISRIAPRPLLVIVGAEDHGVPPAKLAELMAAAGEPKAFWIVPGAGHGGYAEVAPTAYAARLRGFFDCALRQQCPAG